MSGIVEMLTGFMDTYAHVSGTCWVLFCDSRFIFHNSKKSRILNICL